MSIRGPLSQSYLSGTPIRVARRIFKRYFDLKAYAERISPRSHFVYLPISVASGIDLNFSYNSNFQALYNFLWQPCMDESKFASTDCSYLS